MDVSFYLCAALVFQFGSSWKGTLPKGLWHYICVHTATEIRSKISVSQLQCETAFKVNLKPFSSYSTFLLLILWSAFSQFPTLDPSYTSAFWCVTMTKWLIYIPACDFHLLTGTAAKILPMLTFWTISCLEYKVLQLSLFSPQMLFSLSKIYTSTGHKDVQSGPSRRITGVMSHV